MKEVIVLMQEQNTTVRKKGQHLTSFERGRIATLHSQGYSNRAIARALNVCHQTINNELCRGEIDQVKKKWMVNANITLYTHQKQHKLSTKLIEPTVIDLWNSSVSLILSTILRLICVKMVGRLMQQ